MAKTEASLATLSLKILLVKVAVQESQYSKPSIPAFYLNVDEASANVKPDDTLKIAPWAAV